MKKLISFVLITFFVFQNINAQLSRYPYVQSTTQHSTIIAWRTTNPVLGIVKFGLDSANLNQTVTEAGTSKNHGLLLENLAENTKYYYAVYSGVTFETQEFFYTAKDSSNNNFAFIQYGDCGYNNAIQKQVGALMEADDAEFAVICGDLDQGGVPHISDSEGGDDYDEIYFDVYNDGVDAKMLSQECHYTAIGNHDYYANNGAEYDNSFYLPSNNPENSERYYSFTWGDAKFIALDVITPYDNTTFPINFAPIADRWWTDFRAGSAQYQFLENELKCNDKKWVFIYFHEGPWTNYWGVDYNIPTNLGGDYFQYEGNVMVRDHLVPLFEQYDVDFVLAGHSHLYERGEKNGVSYITSGSAGDSNPGGNIQYANHPELTVGILDNIYARFSVSDDSVYLECINKDSLILDTYTKTKPYIAYQVTETAINPSCNQGTDGSININVVGPKGPYSIEWFDNSDTTFTRTNLNAGTYFAYIRNKYDCEKVVAVTLENPPVLVPQIVSVTGSALFCEGDSLTLSTNNNFASYNWSTGNTSAQTNIFIPQTIIVDVIDSNTCAGTSAPFIVDYIPKPLANFNFAHAGFNYNFLSSSSNTSSLTWNFGDGSQDTILTSNLVNHIFSTDGNYDVTLYASNICGTDTFILNVKVGVGVGSQDTTTNPVDSIPNNILNIASYETLDVYPNPFSEKTTINAEAFLGEINVVVYNLLGEKILSFKSSSSSIILNRKELSNGTYFIKIEDSNNKTGLKKVLIN